MPCHCCQIENETFGDDRAQADMKNYRKHGAAKHTRLIIEAIRSLGLKDAALLDIGGGIGAIHHDLLADTVRTATHVDASSAYLKIATTEAQRLGHESQVKFIHADFTDVAAELPQADVVTLDRVVCCYPNMRELLKAVSAKSQKAIAMTYPRDVWWNHVIAKVGNFVQRLRNDPFRVFVHPVSEMEALLNGAGLTRISTRKLFVWEMALYRKM